MTTAELVDLRRAFTYTTAFDGEDEPDDDEEEAAGEGEEDEEGEPKGDDSAPHIKRLNAEAEKHRKKAKAQRKRAEAAEDELKTTRLTLAFTRANLDRTEPFKDLDMAFGLCDLGAIKWDDEGQPLGLTDAMDHLAERYPYLVDDSGDAPDPDEYKPSGRSVTRRKGQTTLNTKALAKKYPALWGR